MTNADTLAAQVLTLTDDQLIQGIDVIEKMTTTEPKHRMVNAYMSDELTRRYPEAGAIVSAMYEDEACDDFTFLDMFHAATKRLAAVSA